MKNTNLDRLLQRYITGQVTDQERKKIEAWLDVKKTDEGSEMVLDEQDEERLFRKITANIDNVSQIRSFRPKGGSVRAMFAGRWLQIAATLLILVAASYGFWKAATQPAVYEASTEAAGEKVILADGSIVWLEEDSRLTYVNNGDARLATFSGQALFEVAKDPEHPFMISCEEVRLRVVGTSFHLDSRKEGVELRVLTGKVRLSAGNQEAVEVISDEVATYRRGGAVNKATFDKRERDAITERTEYNMAFRNTSLEEVGTRIADKFDVEVIISDQRARACRITADFTDHSLESTLQMIAELLEIQYHIGKDAVTVSGRGCH